MANVATAQTALPVHFKGAGGNAYLVPVVITMDTPGADLTIYTPAATAYAAIAGMQMVETTGAVALTIKSGSTTLVTLELPASALIDNKVGEGLKIIGAKGEALKFNAATTAPSSILVYILEFEQLYIEQ